MTTRIGTGGPATGVSASASALRVTAAPAQPFKSVMSAGASAILQGAEQAVTRLPGGPILAAALRPGPADAPAGTASPAAATPGLVPEGGSSSPEAAASVTGANQASGLESVLSEGANQNLYFIQMQERINAETRDYSARSNILKAQHDTIKNAIGNLR